MSNAATTTQGRTTTPRKAKATTTRKATTRTAKATPAPKAPAQPTACRCGCKANTTRPGAHYVAGHDARHAGVVGRLLIANPDWKAADVASALATLPTPALRKKAEGMVATHEARQAKADAIRAAKAEAKAIYETALAKALRTA